MSFDVARWWTRGLVGGLAVATGVALLASGCSDGALPGLENPVDVSGSDVQGGGSVVRTPGGLVQAELAGEHLTFWPYTGRDLSGTPADPVNLIFAGAADPKQIRDALLGLDGDRTAFGFPPVFPFNATWTEAIGDVQTNYATPEGWIGNVVQLQLGSYESIRFHVRLFRTSETFAGDGGWTVGAAHFEVLIPGTADHQVLSWEHAEQIVVADLIRSGLLDPATPPTPSGGINEAPSYREIPPFIYNELPPELRLFIGGPPTPVEAPVGIPNDGNATILRLAGTAPRLIGPRQQAFSLNYDQVVPKPFCSDGPADWVHVAGPVSLQQVVEVDPDYGYEYHSRISGRLTVTPVDITQMPPTPLGEPFEAVIGDKQHGLLTDLQSRVDFQTRRVAPQEGGTELNLTHLKVVSRGAKLYTENSQCLE